MGQSCRCLIPVRAARFLACRAPTRRTRKFGVSRTASAGLEGAEPRLARELFERNDFRCSMSNLAGIAERCSNPFQTSNTRGLEQQKIARLNKLPQFLNNQSHIRTN